MENKCDTFVSDRIHTQIVSNPVTGRQFESSGTVRVLSMWRHTGIINVEKWPLQKIAVKTGMGLSRLRTGSPDRLVCNEASGSIP
jgi:hypothetical protein